MAAKLRATTSSPRRLNALETQALMAATAWVRGSTPERAKKHGCMTVLMRWPMPASRATLAAFTTHSSRRLSITSRWTSWGRWPQTWSAGQGLLSRKVAPSAARPSTSMRSRKWNWWQATKLARSIR
jgi:hypothetical protein